MSAITGPPQPAKTVVIRRDKEPVRIKMLYDEPARESYLEILRLPEREIVTVVEVLSPSK